MCGLLRDCIQTDMFRYTDRQSQKTDNEADLADRCCSATSFVHAHPLADEHI